MSKFTLSLLSTLTIVTSCIAVTNDLQDISFHDKKLHHVPRRLTENQVLTLAEMTDVGHMEELLDNICVERVVGTPNHENVKNYIQRSMKNLGWTVETDAFEDVTPNFGVLKFENVVAKLNPEATRYLTLACHYDSMYMREGDFVGATDSAIPCAQLINLAKVMKDQLNTVKANNVSLMFVFFDGEEAFQFWSPTDSIYGARHLAAKWNDIRSSVRGTEITELDKIDVLVLLDLIGAPDPAFYNYFDETERWYSLLVNAENQLAHLRKLKGYSYGKPQQRYFKPFSVRSSIEDDHLPFLRRGVPILHLIPHPFPKFWHTSNDNRRNIDMATTENISKILRIFVASYLQMTI